MTSERIKEIQQQTAYPDSLSVQQALLQVWNECSQDEIDLRDLDVEAKENLYTEEQVREALFYALNINRTTCCTTRTTDSIVREIIQSLKPNDSNAQVLNIQDKEREMIIKALKKHNGQRRSAAQELGISERTMYRKLKELKYE
jgi:transcriptional regulator of acetoin/glycerol metabolism